MCNSVLGNKMGKTNDKNIIISMSLLMRLFEFMHEDAKDDVAMHNVMEKIVAFTDGINPLTMEVYDSLISGSETKEEDEATEDDMDSAYNLGKSMANCCVDMQNVDYSDVGKIITTVKDDGYGASNGELEQFWNGYENCNEIETLQPSCFSNYDVDMSQYDCKPTTFTICADDECYDNEEECCDIPVESIDEIEKIITIAKGF